MLLLRAYETIEDLNFALTNLPPSNGDIKIFPPSFKGGEYHLLAPFRDKASLRKKP